LDVISPSCESLLRTSAQEGGALPGEDLVGLAAGRGGNGRYGRLPGFVHARSADAAHKP
jgi:hypothetical protein